MAGLRMQDMSRSLMMKMPLDPGFRLYMASVVGWGAEAATMLALKATGPPSLNFLVLYLTTSTEAKPSLTNGESGYTTHLEDLAGRIRGSSHLPAFHIIASSHIARSSA